MNQTVITPDQIIDTLNELIELNRDGQSGIQDAAGKIQDPQIKAFFLDRWLLFHHSAAAITEPALFLNGRTGNGAVRAKDTAVARFGPQYRVAVLTFVKPLAGIGGHALGFQMTAFGTAQGRVKLD